jgi:hypothetical protein
MAITKTFTTAEQLDAEGKAVDKIFTITETETIENVKTQTLSGTEVAERIKGLELMLRNTEKSVLELTEQINFLKSLK